MGSCSCILDWLEFTYHFNYSSISDVSDQVKEQLHAFSEEFPMIWEDMSISGIQRKKGMLNYDTVFDISQVYRVFYHSLRPDMGIHVCFPGHAMSLVPLLFSIPSFESPDFVRASQIFEHLFTVSDGWVKLTRIDLAFDDFDKVYSPADYFELQRQHRIRSTCRQAKHFSNMENPEEGSTWYLGTRGSGRFLRIYDKEYESKGEIKSIRYELELRDRHALAYAKEIVEHSSTIDFGGIVQDMFVVLDPLPGDPSKYSPASISVMKTRLGVSETWLGILRTQVSRRVFVSVPRRQRIQAFDPLHAYAMQYRKSAKMMIDIIGVDSFLELVQSAQYSSDDLKRLNTILKEVNLYANRETCRDPENVLFRR